MKKIVVSCVVAAGLFSSGSALADAKNTAVLQGLDKVTARTQTFDVPLNQTVKFGSLDITLRHCDRTPPEEPPESAAFLEIVEKREGADPKQLFSGWMFASSPALSALQHPVYDVWVLECVNRQDKAENTTDDPAAGEQQQSQ
ncbi:DUF2155 domain-containing protein [Aestuariispira ectoiniformans]|uniref:DUF2155 domain-containing protein n=1 Tax=Aestuariispira ectoiniformans TaxID=2775080 RepID=UPI00223B1B6B|nr:DUF2155 domain-containing protein [Aestuariispira ectoiniformans]